MAEFNYSLRSAPDVRDWKCPGIYEEQVGARALLNLVRVDCQIVVLLFFLLIVNKDCKKFVIIE